MCPPKQMINMRVYFQNVQIIEYFLNDSFFNQTCGHMVKDLAEFWHAEIFTNGKSSHQSWWLTWL